ncbi:MAG: DUF448 domain-containing protein [Clostridiales bacterium]|uniref:YlxR domain-containing protein n=1 Tax=Harryflintia acetispora TaxID=1849041 RepID=A0A9X8UIS5_9FIRM|nr:MULTISPECIES: YlxR family protein [Oscillospiraceae]PWM38778.1 MAG: DUF448 domain-containing protein [Clostridiales bacterium]RGB63542.1 YlxR family protein [Harryflintia acetispora]TCL42939.1 hypothetical protein EDD78_10740 [Harryflintia acetispora]
MAQQRKIPMRMCSGCMEHKPKKELIRVVRTPEGEIKVDHTSKCSGRGAYVCPDIECLRKALKARRFERALACQIPKEIYQRLEEELLDGGQ